MSIRQQAARVSEAIDTFSNFLGRTVSWLTLFMVITMFSVAVLRYVFNIGWIAMQESIIYMHACVFLLGAAFTLQQDGHVRVDIFYRGASIRYRALVDLLGSLFLLLPVCIFIFWSSWGYVSSSWALSEGSREAGGLPGVYLLKSTILLMAATVSLQGISIILKNLLILSNRSAESSRP
jgi:TRAP-type mannitol/chloroaromatic compound transport system permease small subunit